jgi:hypothetical protein
MPVETSKILIDLYFDKNPEVYNQLYTSGELRNKLSNYTYKQKFRLQLPFMRNSRDPYKMSFEKLSEKISDNVVSIDMNKNRKNINHLFFSLVYRKLIKQENIPNGLEILETMGRYIKLYYCLNRNDKLPQSMSVCEYTKSGCGGDSQQSMETLLINITNLENYIDVQFNFIKYDLTNYIYHNDYYILNIPYLRREQENRKLVSCAISIRTFTSEKKYFGHGFNGYICNGIPYLFDSNNIIFQDDWVNGDFTNYIKYYKNTYIKEQIVTKLELQIDYYVYITGTS